MSVRSVGIRGLVRIGTLALVVVFPGPETLAQVTLDKGYVGLEAYYYPEDGLPAQKHGNASVIGQLELRGRWGEEFAAKLTPFVRVDAIDSHRSLFDAREAELDFSSGRWRAELGMRTLSWSVTESVGVLPLQVVDIINQRDMAGDPAGQEKLGEAMATVSYQGESTRLEAFALPWFRRRKFPDETGRENPFRGLINLTDAGIQYTSEKGSHEVGGALRAEFSADTANVALIQYRGYAPQPLIMPDFATGKARELYYLVDMSGLTVQAALGQWLLKTETAYFGTHENPARFSAVPAGYWSSVSGAEYTFVGAFGSSDLGAFAEGMFDSRGRALNGTPFHEDLFAGLRWVANDQSDTQILGGVMYGLDQHAVVAQLQFQRRLGTHYQVDMRLRAYDAAKANPLGAFNDDSVALLRLQRFF
jgi:hypothetical protein